MAQWTLRVWPYSSSFVARNDISSLSYLRHVANQHYNVSTKLLWENLILEGSIQVMKIEKYMLEESTKKKCILTNKAQYIPFVRRCYKMQQKSLNMIKPSMFIGPAPLFHCFYVFTGFPVYQMALMRAAMKWLKFLNSGALQLYRVTIQWQCLPVPEWLSSQPWVAFSCMSACKWTPGLGRTPNIWDFLSNLKQNQFHFRGLGWALSGYLGRTPSLWRCCKGGQPPLLPLALLALLPPLLPHFFLWPWALFQLGF